MTTLIMIICSVAFRYLLHYNKLEDCSVICCNRLNSDWCHLDAVSHQLHTKHRLNKLHKPPTALLASVFRLK